MMMWDKSTTDCWRYGGGSQGRSSAAGKSSGTLAGQPPFVSDFNLFRRHHTLDNSARESDECLRRNLEETLLSFAAPTAYSSPTMSRAKKTRKFAQVRTSRRPFITTLYISHRLTQLPRSNASSA